MGDSTTHAELSPSKRHRWAACPGSIREEARYPEHPAGDPAIQGTRTHTVLERAVLWEMVHKRGPLDLVKLASESLTDDTGTWVVGYERADRVSTALDWIREQIDEHSIVKAEQRVHPDGLVGRADLHGTVDIQIERPKFDRGVYIVMDYKDGIGAVEVQNNPQLTQYGIGVLAEMPPERHPRIFRFVVVQPKNAFKGMPAIATWDVTTQELLAMVPVIVAQAAATEDPNAPLVPGEAQCKWCRAKGSCPAIAGKVMKEMSIVSDLFGPISPVVLPAASPDMAQQAANKDPSKMGDAELRQIMEAAPLVEMLLKGVKDEVKRRLESGSPVPGFKLVRGKVSREWNLSDEEMAKKLSTMGAPRDAVYKRSLVSPAQAESLSWEKDGKQVKFSERQIKNLNSEYVTNKQGGVQVAHESDPRPAIVTDSSNLFGPINVQATVVTPPSIFGPVPSFFGGIK